MSGVKRGAVHHHRAAIARRISRSRGPTSANSARRC